MSKNYVIVILGKFGVGKTTIANLLQEKYGYERVITCTTRAMREGERNGIDYHFLNDGEYEDLASKGKLAAINRVLDFNDIEDIKGCFDGEIPNINEDNVIELKDKNGRVLSYSKKYGVPVEKIDLEKGTYICVLEPSGYFDLLNKMGRDNVKGIYLNLNDKERWLRTLNREINPNVDDIVQKHLEEKYLYDNIEKECDKVIDNAGTSDSATLEIYKYISNLK